VVILNGASSSGKTTIAERFRDERGAAGECWVVMGNDDFLARLPHQWFDVGVHHGPFAADGIRFEASSTGVQVRVGEVGRRLLAGYRRAVAATARAGLPVVVDEVTFDAVAARDWEDALEGLDITWVAVRCDLEVVEARERARSDREPGLARAQTAVVHDLVRYDGELDSTVATVEQLVATLTRIVAPR
jgi:chloramphenicol 3-O phosphotransferase